MINTARTIHFLHIGKTGGTAIKYALKDFQSSKGFHLICHPHATTLAEVPSGDLAIFVLRDPVDRFISGFNSRRRQGRPRYVSSWSPEEAAAFGYFGSANALGNGLLSRDIGVRLHAQEAMRSIQHVKTRYDDWLKDVPYLRTRSADILWTGRTETLAQDFEVLKQILGVPADCQLPDDPVLAHRHLAEDDGWLDGAARSNIMTWYKSDYALLECFAGGSMQA